MEQRELATLRIALRASQDMLQSREALIGGWPPWQPALQRYAPPSLLHGIHMEY